MLRSRLLLAALALLAAPAAADDALDARLWEGCEGCTRIDPPAYMAPALASLDRARDPEGIALAGPACRDVGAIAPGWQFCRFETPSSCGHLELGGSDGRLQSIRFGGRSGPGTCSEARLRSFLRVMATILLRCRDEAGYRRALDLLLTRALDLRSDEVQAALETDPSLPLQNDIGAACGSMRGDRVIAPMNDGTREDVTLHLEP